MLNLYNIKGNVGPVFSRFSFKKNVKSKCQNIKLSPRLTDRDDDESGVGVLRPGQRQERLHLNPGAPEVVSKTF